MLTFYHVVPYLILTNTCNVDRAGVTTSLTEDTGFHLRLCKGTQGGGQPQSFSLVQCRLSSGKQQPIRLAKEKWLCLYYF